MKTDPGDIRTLGALHALGAPRPAGLAARDPSDTSSGVEQQTGLRFSPKGQSGRAHGVPESWHIGDSCLTAGLQARALSQSMKVFTPQ